MRHLSKTIKNIALAVLLITIPAQALATTIIVTPSQQRIVVYVADG
jgi:hypothetical protein